MAAVCALGQVQQVRPPARKAGEETGPQGEQKLRWACRQLKLDEKQMQQVEALIAVYHAELKGLEAKATELLQELQDKFAELQAARNDGNEARVKELQEELRNMAPSAQAENHFFEGLEQVLTDQQKAKLATVRKRAETVGDISLRPIHVLRAAHKVSLTLEQYRQLEKILDQYRSALAGERPENQYDADQRVEQLVQDVRVILTPAQAAAYDQQIDELREGPPAPKPIQLPGADATTQPARPPVPPRPAPRPGTPPGG
jgi:Spy/CpxP family protein refolding chaperone